MTEDAPRETRTTPLGEDDEVIVQQNVGVDNMEGGGEWPDPDTPPSESAPGPDLAPHRDTGRGQFDQAYEDEAEADIQAEPDFGES